MSYKDYTMAFMLSSKKEQLKKKGSGYNADYTVTSDFVRSNLLSYAKGSSTRSKSMLIPCPFHSESEPSLSIILNSDHRLPVGSWKCFGCNRSGHWNILAEALHLPLVDSEKS
jgi:DNA primase